MTRCRQEGFTLVAAIFLMVVLAAVSAYIVRVGALQAGVPTAALQSARAWQAARAGLEWGLAQTGGLAVCPSPALADTAITFTDAGLAGFRVTVTFACSDHEEGVAPVTGAPVPVAVFTIEAKGEFGVYGKPDYVARRLRATTTGS